MRYSKVYVARLDEEPTRILSAEEVDAMLEKERRIRDRDAKKTVRVEVFE